MGRFGSLAQLTNPNTPRLLLNAVKCIGKFSTTSNILFQRIWWYQQKGSGPVLCSSMVCFTHTSTNFSTLTHLHLGEIYKCSWLKVLFVLMMKSVMVLPVLVWLSNVTLGGPCQCQFLPSLCQWRLCQWHLMACRPTKQPQNGCKTIPRGNESNEVIPGTLKGMFPFEMSVEALGISLATIENCAFICWYGRYK